MRAQVLRHAAACSALLLALAGCDSGNLQTASASRSPCAPLVRAPLSDPGLGCKANHIVPLTERANWRSVTTKTTGRLDRLEFSEIKVADRLQGFGCRAVLQVAG